MLETAAGAGVIVCVSANPALDVCLRVPRLTPGGVQRASAVRRSVGGKATHVALAARSLGASVLLVGWFGGNTGERCQQQLQELGLRSVVVPTRCETRQNLGLLDDQACSTEVLEPGGPVERSEVEALLRACSEVVAALGAGDALVLSGSLPAGAPLELFAELVCLARRARVPTFVDTSGAVLDATLEARPDWIKPNHEEAAQLVGSPVADLPSAVAAAHALRARGAARVVVSRGPEGMIVAAAAGAFEAKGPVATARSSVGCGDATLAGLAVAASRGASLVDTMKLAVACGHANCRASVPGQLSFDLVERTLSSVRVAALAGGCA